MQEAQSRLQRALVVAKHATAAANEATAAVEAASFAAAASAATAEAYARAAGVSLAALSSAARGGGVGGGGVGGGGGDSDPFVISARAAARAARLARVEVEAASQAAREAIEAAAKRAAASFGGGGMSGDGDGGGRGKELALVENDEEEGEYGTNNGFVDLNGDDDGEEQDLEDEEEEENGKRRRNATMAATTNDSKRTRQQQQQQQRFSSSHLPHSIGREMVLVDSNNDTSDTRRKRFLNGVGMGNGVYFDGGDGEKVPFRVSVTIGICDDAAVRLGLPLDDRDRRLVDSLSSQSKSMPLVFIERAAFEDSEFFYGERNPAPASAVAAARARAAKAATPKAGAQILRELFFPHTAAAQSSEFVFRGRHRAWVMRYFIYPPNKRQITSGLSPLIRDCFGSGGLAAAGGGRKGAARKKREGEGGGDDDDDGDDGDGDRRLSSLWTLVAWRGQDGRSGGGGGGGGGGGKGGGGNGNGDDHDDDDDETRTDEPGSVLLPSSGQRVPAIWIEFAKVKPVVKKRKKKH